MKTINLVAMVLLGSSVAFTSCNDDDDYMMENQTFVTQASSSNNLEIQAGTLAMEQSSDTEVHHYGEHMVTDHGTAGEELMALASDNEWQIPQNLLTAHQNMLNELVPLSGDQFDKAFMRIMVQSHQEAVALFEQASRNNGVKDNELRAWAADKLPVLRGHLQDAIELQQDIN